MNPEWRHYFRRSGDPNPNIPRYQARFKNIIAGLDTILLDKYYRHKLSHEKDKDGEIQEKLLMERFTEAHIDGYDPHVLWVLVHQFLLADFYSQNKMENDFVRLSFYQSTSGVTQFPTLRATQMMAAGSWLDPDPDYKKNMEERRNELLNARILEVQQRNDQRQRENSSHRELKSKYGEKWISIGPRPSVDSGKSLEVQTKIAKTIKEQQAQRKLREAQGLIREQTVSPKAIDSESERSWVDLVEGPKHQPSPPKKRT